MSYRSSNTLTREEREAHEAKWGNYNAFPPGWRRISPKKFAQSGFFCYAPDLVEYRQMLTQERDKPAVSAHLNFMWDGSGYALVSDYWKGTVHFYAFGCAHSYIPDKDFVPQFRCNNGFVCTKCGHKYNVDSSD